LVQNSVTYFMDGPLAVSRERCIFHVDRMWTSTKGEGFGSCGRMWTGDRVKNPISCGHHKWMAPNSDKD